MTRTPISNTALNRRRFNQASVANWNVVD